MAAANDASREVAFSSGLKINLHGLPEKITIDKSGANKAPSKVSKIVKLGETRIKIALCRQGICQS